MNHINPFVDLAASSKISLLPAVLAIGHSSFNHSRSVESAP